MAEIALVKRVKYAGDVYKRLLEGGFDIDNAVLFLEGIPDADVAPVVHAQWIEKTDPAGKYFECSHCGAHENKHTAIKGYYCWRCGAKMDGGDNDAESID